MLEFYIILGIIGLIVVGVIITIVKTRCEEKRELKKKYQETLRDFKDI